MLTSGTGEFQGISVGTVGIFTAYKRAIDSSFLPHAFFQPQPSNLQSSSVQKKLSSSPPPPPPPTMAGSGSKGKWEDSSITEKEIKDLRSAGYLAANIAHRLPDEGQITPTPAAGERVVFLPISLEG